MAGRIALWLRTFGLMAFLGALLIGIGYIIGGLIVATYMLVISLMLNIFTYWFSDRVVLRMYGARIIEDSELPWLHSMVEDLAEKANIPKPRIAIVHTSTPNAFATGRNPKHSVVAVTDGLLSLLNREEIRGVLGHELTHIKNRDMLIGTIAAVLSTAIVYLAYAARWLLLFFVGGDERDGESVLFLILMSIFAPIAALLVRMAISRSREFLADEGSARLTGNPEALARALLKLERGVERYPMQSSAASTAHLFIVNPLRSSLLVSLFSTHPSTESRIENLRKIAEKMGVTFRV